jgi:hypothetical protein
MLAFVAGFLAAALIAASLALLAERARAGELSFAPRAPRELPPQLPREWRWERDVSLSGLPTQAEPLAICDSKSCSASPAMILSWPG